MAKFRGSDVLTVLRGLNAVSRAARNVTEKELKEAWSSSSVRSGLSNVNLINFNAQDLPQYFSEAAGRSLAVAKGMTEFSQIALRQFIVLNSKTEPTTVAEVHQGIFIASYFCAWIIFVLSLYFGLQQKKVVESHVVEKFLQTLNHLPLTLDMSQASMQRLIKHQL